MDLNFLKLILFSWMIACGMIDFRMISNWSSQLLVPLKYIALERWQITEWWLLIKKRLLLFVMWRNFQALHVKRFSCHLVSSIKSILLRRNFRWMLNLILLALVTILTFILNFIKLLYVDMIHYFIKINEN
jgi:hypothetical protein